MPDKKVSCAQAQTLSQKMLDGFEPTYAERKSAARHREDCPRCLRFHSLLLQAVALASDIPAEDIVDDCRIPDLKLPLELVLRQELERKGILQKILSLISVSIPIRQSFLSPDKFDTKDGNENELALLRRNLNKRSENSGSAKLLGRYKFVQENANIEEEAGKESLRLLIEKVSEESRNKISAAHLQSSSAALDSTLQPVSKMASETLPEHSWTDLLPSQQSAEAGSWEAETTFLPKSADQMLSILESSDEGWSTYPDKIAAYSDCTADRELKTSNTMSSDSDRMEQPAAEIPGIITDQDGWTTMLISEIIQKSEAPKEAAIFSLSEEEINLIFSRMIIGETEKSRSSAKPASVSPPSASEDKLAQFGKIAIAKLDSHLTYSGQITDIGKFLLDPDSVYAFEQILKSKSGKAKSLSAEQMKLIQSLQSSIARQRSVCGSIVMAHDGSILSAMLPDGESADDISAWSLAARVNSQIASRLLNANQMRDLILSGEGRTLIISDFGGFLLITLAENQSAKDLDRLLQRFEGMRS